MMSVFIKNRDGFVFDEATQTLMPYEFKSAIVNFSTGTVIHKCLVGGLEREYSGTFNVYLNEDYFKRNEVYKGTGWTFEEVVERVHRCYPHDEVMLYGFVNGEACLVDVSVFDYILDAGQDWKSADGKKYFPSASRVYDFHDYKVQDENGDVRVVKSPASLLALTDEQRSAVLDFEAITEKMRALNIRMYYDMEGGTMQFINNEHRSYDTWSSEEPDKVYISGMGETIPFNAVSYSSCDWDIAVTLKKS
jgi:hypothetical protein